MIECSKRLLKEPLLHFLLLGAALFGVFAALSGRDEPGRDTIIVTQGKIEHLTALFARTRQRPPTREELKGLIDDHVREELTYREGKAIGLDQNDTVIRRRIRQKMEFIAQDFAAQAEPTEQELAEYLAAHPDRFRVAPRLTLRHVYLDPDRRRDRIEADATELLVALNEDRSLDATQLGDQIQLEYEYVDVSTRDLAGLFGDEFASQVVALETGGWQGPVESGYGVHLVFIVERTEGRLPDLDEVRHVVRREWENERRHEAMERFYSELLARYEVQIQWPEPPRDADP